MKKVLCLLLAVVLMLGVAGCGENINTSSSSKNNTDDVKNFDVDDLKINISERLLDGEKVVCFNYDNNSNHTVSEVRIIYRMKDQTSIDNIKALGKPFTEADFDDFFLEGDCLSVTKPGASSELVELTICDDDDVDTEAVLEYVTPESLFVEYVDDAGYIQQIQHEYASGKDIESADPEKAYQWSDSEMAKLLPKPNVEIVKTDCDFEEKFVAKLRVSSEEDFEVFVNQCKDAGFTSEGFSNFMSYNAKNDLGYSLTLTYYDTQFVIYVILNAPNV